MSTYVLGSCLLEYSVESAPHTEVVVRYKASPRKIIVMLELVMASVPSALGAACVRLAKPSLIQLALQLFYDNKQILFPWHNVKLHLKIECFLSWAWNFSPIFFLPRIIKKFVLIYVHVSKCLVHAVAHCLGLKCQWCLLKTHAVIAAACWSFRFKWQWSGSREALCRSRESGMHKIWRTWKCYIIGTHPFYRCSTHPLKWGNISGLNYLNRLKIELIQEVYAWNVSSV